MTSRCGGQHGMPLYRTQKLAGGLWVISASRHSKNSNARQCRLQSFFHECVSGGIGQRISELRCIPRADQTACIGHLARQQQEFLIPNQHIDKN